MSLKSVTEVDVGILAERFMTNALQTGRLQQEGTALEIETAKEFKEPGKIVQYLQKVGKNFSDQLECVKCLEKIKNDSIEDKIFGGFADSLEKVDRGLDPMLLSLFNRVFILEMDAVKDLFEVADAKMKAFRKDPLNKGDAETAVRAVDDRFSIIQDIKQKCGIQCSEEDAEILTTADKQIGAIFHELFPKKEEKTKFENDNPFEDDDSSIDPLQNPVNPLSVQNSESEEEMPPLDDSSEPLRTKSPQSRSSTPLEGLIDSEPSTEIELPSTTPVENQTKTEVPSSGTDLTTSTAHRRSPTSFENPPELTSLQKTVQDLINQISQLEQIAKGQGKPVDQNAIKGLVEKALKPEELNSLRGLIYKFAKDENANDPHLKEWDFGNKYLAANLTRLTQTLTELSQPVLAKAI